MAPRLPAALGPRAPSSPSRAGPSKCRNFRRFRRNIITITLKKKKEIYRRQLKPPPPPLRSGRAAALGATRPLYSRLAEVFPPQLAPRCATIGPASPAWLELQHPGVPGSASAHPSGWQCCRTSSYLSRGGPAARCKGAATRGCRAYLGSGGVGGPEGPSCGLQVRGAGGGGFLSPLTLYPPGSCNACGKFHHFWKDQPTRRGVARGA